jgi:hypothetical protein
MRGPEYAIGTETVTIDRDTHQTVRLVLDRLADLPARGWWSGDLHVHMNYGGAYRNTPEHLRFQALAEGLHLVENLVVNKEQRIPDIGYFRTTPDPVSDADFLLLHGEEFHTSFWGHTALLGLKEHFLLPNYAAYANTAAASLVPTNSQIFDLAHAQGALTGYVHPFDTRPDPENRAEPLRYALPVDVALGKLDYVEVMGYSDHLITSNIWYRLLNCGFRLPAGAGTDAFPNFASLRGPAGLVRVFVRIGATLDPEAFLEGLRRGRTFVTNAPLLEFEIDAPEGALISEASTAPPTDRREAVGTRNTANAPPNRDRADTRSMSRRAEIGDEIRLAPGRHVLRARVAARSHVPIDRVEIVRNAAVVASVPLGAVRMDAVAEVPLETAESGWYVLRAYSLQPRLPVLDLYPFASTSPIYVTVGDRPVRLQEDASFFLAWIDRLGEEVEAHRDWNTSTERDTTLAWLASARAEFERRAHQP